MFRYIPQFPSRFEEQFVHAFLQVHLDISIEAQASRSAADRPYKVVPERWMSEEKVCFHPWDAFMATGTAVPDNALWHPREHALYARVQQIALLADLVSELREAVNLVPRRTCTAEITQRSESAFRGRPLCVNARAMGPPPTGYCNLQMPLTNNGQHAGDETGTPVTELEGMVLPPMLEFQEYETGKMTLKVTECHLFRERADFCPLCSSNAWVHSDGSGGVRDLSVHDIVVLSADRERTPTRTPASPTLPSPVYEPHHLHATPTRSSPSPCYGDSCLHIQTPASPIPYCPSTPEPIAYCEDDRRVRDGMRDYDGQSPGNYQNSVHYRGGDVTSYDYSCPHPKRMRIAKGADFPDSDQKLDRVEFCTTAIVVKAVKTACSFDNQEARKLALEEWRNGGHDEIEVIFRYRRGARYFLRSPSLYTSSLMSLVPSLRANYALFQLGHFLPGPTPVVEAVVNPHICRSFKEAQASSQSDDEVQFPYASSAGLRRAFSLLRTAFCAETPWPKLSRSQTTASRQLSAGAIDSFSRSSRGDQTRSPRPWQVVKGPPGTGKTASMVAGCIDVLCFAAGPDCGISIPDCRGANARGQNTDKASLLSPLPWDRPRVLVATTTNCALNEFVNKLVTSPSFQVARQALTARQTVLPGELHHAPESARGATSHFYGPIGAEACDPGQAAAMEKFAMEVRTAITAHRGVEACGMRLLAQACDHSRTRAADLGPEPRNGAPPDRARALDWGAIDRTNESGLRNMLTSAESPFGPSIWYSKMWQPEPVIRYGDRGIDDRVRKYTLSSLVAKRIEGAMQLREAAGREVTSRKNYAGMLQLRIELLMYVLALASGETPSQETTDKFPPKVLEGIRREFADAPANSTKLQLSRLRSLKFANSLAIERWGNVCTELVNCAHGHWQSENIARRVLLRDAIILCSTMSGCGVDAEGSRETSRGRRGQKLARSIWKTPVSMVVLDEGGQAKVSDALIPIMTAQPVALNHRQVSGQSAQRPATDATRAFVPVLVVGDEDQLGPFTRVRNPQSLSTFVRQSIMQRIASMDWQNVTVLTTQYRMTPTVARIPLNTFYPGREFTNAHPDGASRQWFSRYFGCNGADSGEVQIPSIDIRCPVVFLTSGNDPRFSERKCTSSQDPHRGYDNHMEAVTCVQVLQVLQRLMESRPGSVDESCMIGGRSPSAEAPALQVRIIAPYRSQVELLRRTIARSIENPEAGKKPFTDWFQIRTGSVDEFQGQDCDIVILSTVRTRSRQRGSLSTGGQNTGIGFVDDPRRINVSLTRARHMVVVVGDLEHLSAYGSWGSIREQLENCVREYRMGYKKIATTDFLRGSR